MGMIQDGSKVGHAVVNTGFFIDKRKSSTLFSPNKKYAVKITSLVNSTEITLDWLNYERFLK